MNVLKDLLPPALAFYFNKPASPVRSSDTCFRIERLIDPNCNGKRLTIGITTRSNPYNALSNQGIRLGKDEPIKHLVSFVRTNNALLYVFENNTFLTLTKNSTTNKIVYSLETPETKFSKEIDDDILRMYKTIDMESTQLDAIVELR
jgi:hypothetical protein